MINNSLPQQSALYDFLQKFARGSVILEQLTHEKSELRNFLEVITMEFILYNLEDDQARHFLDLLESSSPSIDPVNFAEQRIPDFQNKLKKEIEEKVKRIIDT